jgi:hypothetical protein
LFYLRVHQTQASSAIELLTDYSAKFPADIGWSTVMLEKLQLLASDQFVSLIYAGVTMKGPINRLLQDLRNKPYTRFINLTSAVPSPAWTVFEFQNMTVPTTEEDIVTNVLRNSIESIIISSLGFQSVNSAHGGSYVEYEPTPTTVSIVQHEIVEPMEAATVLVSLRQSVSDHYQAMRGLYVNAGADPVSEEYFDCRVEQAVASLVYGAVPLVVVASETTRRALKLGMGFYSAECGPSPALHHQMATLLQVSLSDQ